MSRWRHFKESKQYKDRVRLPCGKCRKTGRDVRIRVLTHLDTKVQKILCNNCLGDILARAKW